MPLPDSRNNLPNEIVIARILVPGLTVTCAHPVHAFTVVFRVERGEVRELQGNARGVPEVVSGSGIGVKRFAR